jgi:septal ring factor EnvC (AmiA/AmiB activator)
MRKALRTLVVVTAAMLLVLMAFTGCTKYANEQQLQALEETQAAAQAAEKALADCKSETASIEGQLAKQKQALEDMKKEQQAVSQRLAAMGN